MKKYLTLFIATLFLYSCADDSLVPKDPNNHSDAPSCTTPYCDPNGAFILSEGNFSDGNGFISFVSGKDELQTRIFEAVNNKKLGNVAQGLSIAGNRIYVVTQNGRRPGEKPEEVEGHLTVMDRTTLKKIAIPNEAVLDGLHNPLQVAVLDTATLFVVDRDAIYRADLYTPGATPVKIENTARARSTNMVVVGKEVFAAHKQTIVVLDKTSTSPVATIDMQGNVYSIVPSQDNMLWVLTKDATSMKLKFHKVDPATRKVVASHELMQDYALVTYAQSAVFGAKGDTLYFNDKKAKIYRYIFSQENSEKLMVDATEKYPTAKIVYGGIGVNPRTGKVYINVLEDYPKYKEGYTLVYDFTKEDAPAVKCLKQSHHFATGVFFLPTQK